MSRQEQLDEKMEAFMGAHQRILDEFGRSLANARQFLSLAEKSREREPEETQSMLEQIREIDLVGHLTGQFEEFNSLAGVFLKPDQAMENEMLAARLAELQTKYEALLEEADKQMEAIEGLLGEMRVYS